MPRITSFDVIRPIFLSSVSPSSPHQFVCSAFTVVGCAMIAGVQSTVWIFAISAATTRRALSNSCSSDSSGCVACRWSQTTLCSRMNSECSSASPTQKLPATPVRLTFASISWGISPRSSSCSFPSWPVRIAWANAGSFP